MPDLRLRRRARMRGKDVKRLNDAVQNSLGLDATPFPEHTEHAEVSQDLDVLIVDNHIMGLIFKTGDEERPWLSVRGFIQHKPEKRYVTVDMGAIRFVTNGADVMAPGITDADPDVKPGDLVWIRDERNNQALGVGEAILPGPDMVEGGKGKAVKSLHHVGDELWELEL